ncbi:hypothetical protein PYCCODRAFT_1437127 [Trametes coccinea BRFM310]|uniref:P-loop containing nucleoside triphosphate hydrolase protein n=1 Tax=Trametes coccinea (strain BRFM310) TaxID=1353009 RepID=A0A1Y2IHW4_TRAC3|nr:hypothetical protein PYCCODRAFT_1437127 [Trametes coccinea BRFM310]
MTMASSSSALQGPSAHNTLLNSEYGKSSKELIEFVGQLRALGAHIDLELPRIVVIGNQSAGKSSLVEAISGISVPRDAGTCTRCPMECRLSHSAGEWSCQIKIRYEYDEQGKHLDEVEEVDFGPRVTDKALVEGMLRRAQAAVLRPDLPLSRFVKEEEPQKLLGKGARKFSKNVVCIELTGPDLADLSFVDLPGIVQNAEPETVQLVEDMVNSYIQGTSLILVTLPMSDDIENQKAARLAQLADPHGLRTIGVLTKPDTLTAGSTKARQMWLDVLEGRRYPLLHGYYCTRQPDDDERSRGVSGAAAREAEAKFFTKTAPWATSQHQHRFGTANLVQNISKLLTQIIRESLPTFLGQVAAQLEACNAQLDKLPPPITTEPSAYVLALVTHFASDIRSRIEGAPINGRTELVQSTRRIYEAFKDAIRSSAPPFVPYENAARAPRDLSEYVRAVPRDSMLGKRSATQMLAGHVMYLEDVREHIRASVTRELPGNVPYSAKVSLIQGFQQNWADAALACFEEVQSTFKDAVADIVRQEFDRYSALKAIVGPVTMELVNNCTEKTIEQLQAILALESSPFTQNGHYLSECRDKWLAKYKDARAGRGVAERVTPVVPNTAASESPVPPAPSANSTGPATFPQSPHGRPIKPLPSKRPSKGSAGERAQARQSSPPPSPTPGREEDPFVEPRTPATAPRAQPMASTPTPVASERSANPKQTLSPEEQQGKEEAIREALAALAKLGFTGLTETDLGKLNKADEYEEELQLMAEVRAYFQVAYKRVIDYIPLTIDHHFLYAFAAALHERLFERLGLGAANAQARCSAYIAEDPTIVATRDELMAKKKRLENVQRALYNFGL